MNTAVIGIDPGLTGGLCVLNEEGRIAMMFDMPVKPHNGKKRINAKQLLQVLGHAKEELGASRCYIERAQGAGGQGASSIFNYGMGYGMVLACLDAKGIDYTEVSPTKWKRLALLPTGADKSKSVAHARELFPFGAHWFTASKHGRAEASIIAALGYHGKF